MRYLDFNQVHAVRPWDSPYASQFADPHRDRKRVANQKDIDECLSCPKPRCTNCKRYARAV